MTRVRLQLTLIVAAVLIAGDAFLPVVAQERRNPPPYRILIGNDDGVRAPGLAILAQTLQAIGNVIIVGPADNQTGKGHSITIREPIFREEVTLPNGLRAIGLTATPATAMNVAIRNIVTPAPDLVVSGINPGYNLAHNAYVSGTVGVARQAAMHGIPAIASSLAEAGAPRDFIDAAEEVLGVARRVKQWGLPPNTFLNVNIPAKPEGGYKGYLITTQAMEHGGNESFAEIKRPGSGQTIYWNVYSEGIKAPEGTDIWAVENGYVSVTPMKVGETDASQFDALKRIFSK